MKNHRVAWIAVSSLMLLLIPAIVAADSDVGNGPTSDLWQALMKREYALDVVATPAFDVCRFFNKTTGFSFVCSRDLNQEPITIQMKAPFGKIFQIFLDELHAKSYFGPTFAFIAKPNDPGLRPYPKLEYVPEQMRETIIFDFRRETLPAFAEFALGITGIPIEFSPDLGSQFITMNVRDLPFIDAMECLARYLRAPMRLEIEPDGIYGTVYFGSPKSGAGKK
jgi:hypothetical protein